MGLSSCLFFCLKDKEPSSSPTSIALGNSPLTTFFIRKFTFKGPLENGLAVNLELLLGGLDGFHALVQLAEEFFDLGDDAVLFGERGKWEFEYFLQISPDIALKVEPVAFFIELFQCSSCNRIIKLVAIVTKRCQSFPFTTSCCLQYWYRQPMPVQKARYHFDSCNFTVDAASTFRGNLDGVS